MPQGPGGVPLVPMVANPMNPQQLVAMGGQQHGQAPGPKAPPQQHQVHNQGLHSVPQPPSAQPNMSPKPDGSGPPQAQHPQAGMMGPMHMVPVQPGGQMMQGMPPMMQGMPQGMGMGPNPMQSMPSGHTPPPGQNQAAGAYPPSQGMQQGMQPMMPQGMQGMDGQMQPNPQMQQQQFMYVQMNPNMMQQMQMAQMQGGGQQMMMPIPMGGMQMQQGSSPPQVDGNNGQQMGGYAPYNMGMGMPMGGQQQPGQ
jgi:hypothetical protein